jgi:hypothetical protein
MTTRVQELLKSFDTLSEPEKQEAAAHLLRRVLQGVSGDLPGEALVAAAEDLFLELDARKARGGRP